MTQAAAPSSVKIPMLMRAKAWWHGYELKVRVKEPDPRKKAKAAVRQIDEGEWKNARLALIQMVFGEGFNAPGNEEAIINLVKPCGLTSAHNLLDLGAGLGGPARTIAKHFGAWVEGLERDPDFAETGMLLSNKAGIAKKATIETYDAEHLELPNRNYTAVISRDEFFSIEEKERLLGVIKDSLKDNGHLLFTDLVLGKPKLRSKALDAWAQKEPMGAQPVAMEDYLDYLRDLRYDVRISEDISEKTTKAISQCWASFLDELDPTDLNDAMRQALVHEVEIWTQRAKLLESGELKACRIHAVKKVRDDLLSDWSQT